MSETLSAEEIAFRTAALKLGAWDTVLCVDGWVTSRYASLRLFGREIQHAPVLIACACWEPLEHGPVTSIPSCCRGPQRIDGYYEDYDCEASNPSECAVLSWDADDPDCAILTPERARSVLTRLLERVVPDSSPLTPAHEVSILAGIDDARITVRALARLDGTAMAVLPELWDAAQTLQPQRWTWVAAKHELSVPVAVGWDSAKQPVALIAAHLWGPGDNRRWQPLAQLTAVPA